MFKSLTKKEYPSFLSSFSCTRRSQTEDRTIDNHGLDMKVGLSVEVIMQTAITNFYSKKEDVTIDMSTQGASQSFSGNGNGNRRLFSDAGFDLLNDNDVSWAAFATPENHVNNETSRSIDLAGPSEKEPKSFGRVALDAMNDNEVSWAAFASVENDVNSSSHPPRSCGGSPSSVSESIAGPPESSTEQTDIELEWSVETNVFSESVRNCSPSRRK